MLQPKLPDHETNCCDILALVNEINLRVIVYPRLGSPTNNADQRGYRLVANVRVSRVKKNHFVYLNTIIEPYIMCLLGIIVGFMNT